MCREHSIVLREFHVGARDALIIEGEAKIMPRWEWRTFDASLNASSACDAS
jgi:hypothetical protein